MEFGKTNMSLQIFDLTEKESERIMAYCLRNGLWFHWVTIDDKKFLDIPWAIPFRQRIEEAVKKPKSSKEKRGFGIEDISL